MVGRVEAGREAAEEFRVGHLHLALGVVDRRVNQNRLVARRQKIAAPQVAVNENGRGCEVGHQPLHLVRDARQCHRAAHRQQAEVPGALDLGQEPPVTVELGPTRRRRVALRLAAEVVVSVQAEQAIGRGVVPVQGGQRLGEAAGELAQVARRLRRNVFQRQPGRIGGIVKGDDFRHTKRRRRPQAPQAVRLGLK